MVRGSQQRQIRSRRRRHGAHEGDLAAVHAAIDGTFTHASASCGPVEDEKHTIQTVLFRPTLLVSAASIAEERVAAVYFERRKRKEHCELRVLEGSDMSVFSIALPWWIRMIIKLNAMP